MEKEYQEMVSNLKKSGKDILLTLTEEECDRLHMAVGISGEAGELLDAVKKNAVYKKPIDRENVIEELGDLEFYMEGLRQNLNITRQETLEANKIKLLTGKKARYKSGKYSDDQAQKREDKQ